MKLFVPIILVLGVVIAHTHGAPNLLSSVLARPPTKYDTQAQSLDLDSLDLNSLGDFDKEQPNYGQDDSDSTSSYDTKTKPYDTKTKPYDLTEPLLKPTNILDAVPSHTNSLYKKAGNIFGSHKRGHKYTNEELGLKDIYSTVPYSQGSLLNKLPGSTNPIDLEDATINNLLYKLPSGQHLQCVVEQ